MAQVKVDNVPLLLVPGALNAIGFIILAATNNLLQPTGVFDFVNGMDWVNWTSMGKSATFS
jgi:hypothetical protein